MTYSDRELACVPDDDGAGWTVTLSMCETCGALVLDRRLHDEFHNAR